MSNNFNGNPWVLDTAGATSAWAYPVWINKMVWHEPTAGDVLLVKDGVSGNTIWSKTALAGGSGIDEEFPVGSPELYPGFYLTTLGSGTLYVYHD
jgi:hypothetical protein